MGDFKALLTLEKVTTKSKKSTPQTKSEKVTVLITIKFH